ncbi:MAG: hypothetical protein V1774_10525 [Candidatus Eisenbacteria bacterium]
MQRTRRILWVALAIGLMGTSEWAWARAGEAVEITAPVPGGTARVQAISQHIGDRDAVIVAQVPGRTKVISFVLLYEIGGVWVEQALDPAGPVPHRPEALRDEIMVPWQGVIPHQTKGTRVPYYLRLQTMRAGETTIPQGAPEQPLAVTFKGEVSRPALIAHIVAMMGGLLPLAIAFIAAWVYLARGRLLGLTRRCVLIGFGLLFVGGVPLGMIVERQVFGTYWEGWPFGRDVTDTKTGLLLVLWLVLILVRGRSIFDGRPARGGVRDRVWATWVVLLTLLTGALYLIPHENVKF